MKTLFKVDVAKAFLANHPNPKPTVYLTLPDTLSPEQREAIYWYTKGYLDIVLPLPTLEALYETLETTTIPELECMKTTITKRLKSLFATIDTDPIRTYYVSIHNAPGNRYTYQLTVYPDTYSSFAIALPRALPHIKDEELLFCDPILKERYYKEYAPLKTNRENQRTKKYRHITEALVAHRNPEKPKDLPNLPEDVFNELQEFLLKPQV